LAEPDRSRPLMSTSKTL